MRSARPFTSALAAATLGPAAETVQIGEPLGMRDPGAGRSAVQSGHCLAGTTKELSAYTISAAVGDLDFGGGADWSATAAR
jgi:hypothetical protein